MTIELWDMDMPYDVQTDCNAEGKDFVRIMPLALDKDRDENYDICLTKDQCKELARVLNFMAKEIK